MLDLISRRKLFYLMTALLVVPGLISLALPGGLRRGIDFTSSTYSSIFFASMLLVDRESGALGRFFGRRRPPVAAAS
jgi:preprotein translocase subunit SecF